MPTEKDELSILAREGKEITIGDKAVRVRPLVFRDFRKAAEYFGKAVEKLLAKCPDFDPKGDMSSQLEKIIPGLIESCEELPDLIAVCTKEKKDWLLDNMTIEQACDALLAIIEVNGIDRMIKNFSRLAPMMKGD